MGQRQFNWLTGNKNWSSTVTFQKKKEDSSTYLITVPIISITDFPDMFTHMLNSTN
jgi:hypothetical protein